MAIAAEPDPASEDVARPFSGGRMFRVTANADTGPIVLGGTGASWAPLAKQVIVVALLLVAAVVSTLSPWLPVTDATAMWSGAGCGVGMLLLTVAIDRWPGLLRYELLVPAVDFLAVGLLRFGTGEGRSVFLAIAVLPVIWIASNPGRRHIVFPLIGATVTLLVPIAITRTLLHGSEIIRLIITLSVYAAVAAVVNELARQAGLRLDLARRQHRIAESEIVRAAVVQQTLLPSSTAMLDARFEAVGVCLPAKHVGGDFYDWFPTSSGAAFTLGDVMGKGVAAGMIAAAVRSVIRSTVDDREPAHALTRAARGLATGGTDLINGQFTTCVHFRLDHNGTMQWADAGHGLTMLRRASGTIEPLRSSDLPLGVGTSWASSTTTLRSGDAILCISDGVLDLFGNDASTLTRFEQFLDQHSTASATVDAIAVLAAATEHPDDVTMLAVTYRPLNDNDVPLAPA